jgi:cyclohexadienyl dehydratase
MFHALTAMALAVVVLLSGHGQAAAQQASRLDRVIQSGKLRVGTTGDFRPMSFKDPATGRHVGYDIEVVERLAKDMEVALELVPADWKTLVSGVLADKYDLTTSASMNVARAKVAAFSEPFVAFGTVPMTLKANLARFQGWGAIDQPDVTVAVTLGTVFDEQARAFFPKARIRAVEAPARDFQEVLAGRSLVSITSNVEAAALTQTYPELVTIPVDAPRALRPGAFLMDPRDQVWINFVDAWVRMNHANGFFADLQQRWGLGS